MPELQAGEGAFYGPKLEFSLRDEVASGHFMAVRHDPARLRDARALPGLSYIDSRGGKGEAGDASPGDLRVDRTVCGESCWSTTSERSPPGSPLSRCACSISDEQAPYARTILEALQRQGLRASLGPGSQTLSRAIVDACMMPASPSSPLWASAKPPHPKWPCASTTAARAS